MKNIFTYLAVQLLLIFSIYGQSGYTTKFPKSNGLVIGYQGFSTNMLEIGLAHGFEGDVKTMSGTKRSQQMIKKPHAIIYTCLHINPYDNINGAIVGFSLGAFVAYSFDINYYNNDSNNFGIRPSIGLSFYGAEILYRYNFKIIGDKSNPFFGHQFSLRYYLPLFIKT